MLPNVLPVLAPIPLEAYFLHMYSVHSSGVLSIDFRPDLMTETAKVGSFLLFKEGHVRDRYFVGYPVGTGPIHRVDNITMEARTHHA